MITIFPFHNLRKFSVCIGHLSNREALSFLAPPNSFYHPLYNTAATSLHMDYSLTEVPLLLLPLTITPDSLHQSHLPLLTTPAQTGLLVLLFSPPLPHPSEIPRLIIAIIFSKASSVSLPFQLSSISALTLDFLHILVHLLHLYS